MKRSLILLGLSAAFLPAVAQKSSYEVSVFRNANAPVTQAKTGNAANMRTQEGRIIIPGWGINTANITVNDFFGPAITVPGSTLVQKAQYCFDNYLTSAGLNKNDWQLTRNEVTPRATFVEFQQTLNGQEVQFSRISFRFTNDGKLVRINLKSYGQDGITQTPVISAAAALEAAGSDLTDAVITSKTTGADWSWFPVPSANGYKLRPVWSYTIEAATKNDGPLKLTGFVDAISGDILYRTNEIKEGGDLTIKGTVYKNGTLNAATDEPLTDLAVTINGAIYYSDSAGYFNDPNLTLPAVATIPLQGKWSKVFDINNGSLTPTVNDTINAAGTQFVYPATGTSNSRLVNSYYHVNRVHDFMKGYYPTFTGMDIMLPTNVDLTSGTCNAFYNGNSINFYAAGGGCKSFAEIGDIIYHEYGHGISDKFYQAHSPNGSTIRNGALNEASSDIWAISITHNPILGQYCYTNQPNSYIRRYDQTPKVYPQDIQHEVHADGEIIAGAWWDVAVNTGSVDTMTKLFTDVYYDTPDGPNGTEGVVYHDVLISALMSDDDDNNLSNGTPHFTEIVKAFAKHGIYLLSDATITHQEIAHQPISTPVSVNASVSLTYQSWLQDVKLVYRVRGKAWDTLAMTNNGNMNFSAQIPGIDTGGKLIDYYIAVSDITGTTSAYAPTLFNPILAANTSPVTYSQSNIPYQFGIGLVAVDSNQFEGATTGWRIGNNTNDNTTRGIWVQAVPLASYTSAALGSLICQTGNDHTTGSGKCLITGNASSSSQSITTNAVLSGKTTVITPAFDLTGYQQPIIEYYRWYSNDRGSNPRKDQWQVQVRDTVNTLWKNVEYTYQSDYVWRRRIFSVSEFLTSTAHVQLQFTAYDAVNQNLTGNGQSVVEAGIDDFFIYDKVSTNPASVNNVAPAEKAKIYPNPADGVVNISLPANTKGSMGVYDITGKVIYELTLDGTNTNYHIGTSQLPAGQYLLVIKTDNHTIQTSKISVVH
ncbi:T9SS type A sorting domain-containing protein [Taibaiella soli]|nr:T9SS type A sorting domain-containing protein [Taibaiella soli]